MTFNFTLNDSDTPSIYMKAVNTIASDNNNSLVVCVGYVMPVFPPMYGKFTFTEDFRLAAACVGGCTPGAFIMWGVEPSAGDSYLVTWFIDSVALLPNGAAKFLATREGVVVH